MPSSLFLALAASILANELLVILTLIGLGDFLPSALGCLFLGDGDLLAAM